MRESGAVPATVALLDGQVRIGLDDDALDQIASDESVVKASIRDLGVVLASEPAAPRRSRRRHTSHRAQASASLPPEGSAAYIAGPQESWDESADLAALGSIPITVVCAGVKSILDVGATLERLETLVGRAGRLPHRRVPRVLHPRLRLRGAVAARNRRGDRRGDG